MRSRESRNHTDSRAISATRISRHERQGRQSRDPRGEWDQGEHQQGGHHPLDLHEVLHPVGERHVPQQEQRDPPVQGRQRERVERLGQRVMTRITDVLHDLLQAEREQDDAGDHRQVPVAVGVACEPRARLALCATQHPLGDQRDHVEVGPPQAARHRQPQDGRGDHGPRDRLPGYALADWQATNLPTPDAVDDRDHEPEPRRDGHVVAGAPGEACPARPRGPGSARPGWPGCGGWSRCRRPGTAAR